MIAVLQNIQNWEDRLEDIAAHAAPATGNIARALSLKRDLEMARLSLCRLAGVYDDEICQQAADDKPPEQ